MSKPLTTRVANSRGPFPALIPAGKHAGRPAISLRRPITLVGSGEAAHVHLASQSVDPVHALLVVSDGRLYVRDLASHAGVQVNDEPVLEAELGRDDVVKVGTFQFRVSVPPGAGTPGGREAVPAATFSLDGRPAAGMDGHVVLIGRRSSCDLVVTDPKASRVHAAVVAVSGQFVVRDLGSRAGTLVNTDKVHEQVLESGDEVRVASHAVFFHSEAAPAAAGMESGADLVGLEDSMLLEAEPAGDAGPAGEAAVAAAAEEEPDALDLDLPGIGEAEGVGSMDLESPVPMEGVEEEEGPAAEAPAAEEDEEPIPLDLELDVAEPEAASAEPEPEPEPEPELEPEPEAESELVAASEVVAAEEEGSEAAVPVVEPEVDETPIPLDDVEPEPEPVAEEVVREEVAEGVEDVGSPGVEEVPASVAEDASPAGEVGTPAVEGGVEQDELAAVAGGGDEAAPDVAEPEDDLLRLVAEELDERSEPSAASAPSAAVAEDDLSKTPFEMPAAEVEVEPGPAPEAEAEAEAARAEAARAEAAAEAVEPVEEPSAGFGYGANQHYSLMESAVDWAEEGSLHSALPARQLFELSLSGVYGEAEGGEPLADSPDAAEVGQPEPVAAEQPPADRGETPREQLLGFIRVEELAAPADAPAPLEPRGPIEPVRSVVEPSAEDAATAEPAVEMPLESDEPTAGSSATPPHAPSSGVSPPDGLHAAKPPRKSYRITRGLSSLTGGGRAVDVFSQLPLVSDDPVLGKVSGPAQIPPVDDEGGQVEGPVPQLSTEEELNAALLPPGGPESPDVAAADRPGGESQRPKPLFIRKIKRMFREQGGTLSVVLASVAAGAAAYALTPSERIVRAEVHYRNFAHLPASAQTALEARQRELLTDPAVLAAAADSVSVGPGAPGPGFLASPVAASRLVDRADANLWSPNDPGTLALTLRSSDPDADVERLRALTAALVDAPANRRLAGAARESADRVERARAALAALDRDVEKLRHEQVAAQARLASADARGADDVTAALPEPSPEERAWRKASLAFLRAQADVSDLRDHKVGPDDARMKAADARLADARKAEAAARERFVASQARPASSTDDVSVDPERRAADVAASLHATLSRRASMEADLKRLRSDAAAMAYPELPKDGGVWTIRVPDHRNLYAVAAASVVGLSLGTYRAKRRRCAM